MVDEIDINKEEPKINKNIDVDDDDTVQDVTEEMNERAKQEREKIAEDNTIYISSDDDEDDDDEEGWVEEGSDAWEDDSEDSDYSEDSSFEEIKTEKPAILTPNRKRKRADKKATPESPLQVLMDKKDVPAAPGRLLEPAENNEASAGLEETSTLVEGADSKKGDQAVKDRIIKLLNTGFHNHSNENEAKNAMRLAQRLMLKHNLSQALLLRERKIKNSQQQESSVLKGGMVKVSVMNRKTGKPSLLSRWLLNLCGCVSKNFCVKSFHSTKRGEVCAFVFYGIYTNAQLAGYAFRVSAERIAQMTAEYAPTKKASSSISTKSARLSYAMGVVKGISDEVRRNIRVEKEKHERKLARARIAAHTGEAYEESDDEAGDDALSAGFSDGDEHDSNGPDCSLNTPSQDQSKRHNPENGNLASTKSSNDFTGTEQSDTIVMTTRGIKVKDRLIRLERENQAALVLVDHSKNVFRRYRQIFKKKNIKMRAARKRKPMTFDSCSFKKRR